MKMLLLVATITCHTWQTIVYCDGPSGFRSEEHSYGGITYGRDNRGNAWSGHQYGGREYWQKR
jgi:hypothetical protein